MTRIRTLALAMAALTLAGAAQAQGRGNGKAKHDKHKDKGAVVVQRSNGDVVVVPGHERKVPPGLAKKPGQMPPGQYKKLYSSAQGANVLRDILVQRGYVVTQLVPAGQSQYVYYRMPDGRVRRAVVTEGTDRLRFSNVATSIVQAVLARLY
jgi:hypothetical protein